MSEQVAEVSADAEVAQSVAGQKTGALEYPKKFGVINL